MPHGSVQKLLQLGPDHSSVADTKDKSESADVLTNFSVPPEAWPFYGTAHLYHSMLIWPWELFPALRSLFLNIN